MNKLWTSQFGLSGITTLTCFSLTTRSLSLSLINSQSLRSHGVLVAVGLPPEGVIKANVLFTVTRSLRIVGSYVGSRRDAFEALEIAARGKVKTHYKIQGLSDLGQIYEEMKSGKVTGRIVLDVDQ